MQFDAIDFYKVEQQLFSATDQQIEVVLGWLSLGAISGVEQSNNKGQFLAEIRIDANLY